MAVALVETDRDPVFVSPPCSLHLPQKRAELVVATHAKKLLLADEGARSL
jgi:hypothetical protein